MCNREGRLDRKTRLGLQVLNKTVVGEGLPSLDGHVWSRLPRLEVKRQGVRVAANEGELRVVELIVSDGG